MECAAAEQSVPLPVTSQAAQHLLENRTGLPKVAEANLGLCGRREWTDRQLSAPPDPRALAAGPMRALLGRGAALFTVLCSLPEHRGSSWKGMRPVCSAGCRCILSPQLRATQAADSAQLPITLHRAWQDLRASKVLMPQATQCERATPPQLHPLLHIQV